MPGVIAAIERRPQAAFAAFLALHLAVWTALPSLLYPNLPLDLIEALTYGREWQLGYDKLPPLPWWLVESVHRTIGADWAYYALAQLAVVTAFALVWVTARPLVGAAGALVAVLIVDGLHYFQYTAAKFNHDVIQLPLWALAGYAFHATLKRGRLLDWALLGLAIGGAVWAKYFVAVLAAPLALFLLADRDARKSLMTPGPWLALALALAVMAPHLVWLVQNDFLPFAYASARSVKPRGLFDHLLYPGAFAVGQFVFLLPALLIALPLFKPTRQAPVAATADAFDRRIVALITFGPAATLLAIMVLTGRGAVAMWGYPLWLFLGLWLVLKARSAVDRLRLKWIVPLWAAVFVLLAAAFIVNYAVLPRYDHRYRAVFYPGDKLAAELSAKFRALTGKPLTYVVGTMWDGGNVAHYSPEHPRVLIDGSPRRAPWIDVGDLIARGAVVVWTDGDLNVIPPALRTVAADATVQPPFTLPFRRGDQVLDVGWAILLPKPSYANAAP
jgi:4-amino-4-deoxy-L-arabinose transferase-like glycosyltransferase